MFGTKKKVKTTNEKVKTTNEIIEEIHDSFYTEVDKLLASAKILNCLSTDKDELIEKCERLKSLGFENTSEIKEAEIELKRLEKLSEENKSKNDIKNAINYFSFKYPNYKFITEDSVKKICEKYNLIYGTIDRYIGSVPDKNLKHIEEFKVSEDDECFSQRRVTLLIGGSNLDNTRYLTLKEHIKSKERRNDNYSHYYTIDTKCPLEIAAPIKDFNTKGMEVKDSKLLQIPDPVVLKPVYFNSKKHYLIVTAWGIEASDDLIVNERFN